MTRPSDIPEQTWIEAERRAKEWGKEGGSLAEAIARAMISARAESEAERNMLQDILDSRPAINAGLPETYIKWSQGIYSGDIIRARMA